MPTDGSAGGAAILPKDKLLALLTLGFFVHSLIGERNPLAGEGKGEVKITDEIPSCESKISSSRARLSPLPMLKSPLPVLKSSSIDAIDFSSMASMASCPTGAISVPLFTVAG